MDNIERNEALSAFQRVWGDGSAVRAHRIDTDTMKPTLWPGEFAGVVPGQRYDTAGVYLLHNGHGVDVWRCQHIGNGRIKCWQDNPAYTQTLNLSASQFEDCVLGRVVAMVGFIDRDRTLPPRTQ